MLTKTEIAMIINYDMRTKVSNDLGYEEYDVDAMWDMEIRYNKEQRDW